MQSRWYLRFVRSQRSNLKQCIRRAVAVQAPEFTQIGGGMADTLQATQIRVVCTDSGGGGLVIGMFGVRKMRQ